MLEHSHPLYQHDIPYPSSINIGKLGSGSAFTSDKCNGARKTHRIIIEEFHEAEEALRKDDSDHIRVLEVDCWNHLRNLWLVGITKALSTLLVSTIRGGLNEIDLRLRLLTSIASVLCSVDKKFSLCDNYPKVHGDIFREWIETYHPGVLLLHVERALWSRQYLAFKGSEALYMNHPYWIEFLNERLRMTRDNLLQYNIFIILSSLEMTVLARLCDIIHITICLPTRWLAGNCHILDYYNWSVRSMGRIVDKL